MLITLSEYLSIIQNELGIEISDNENSDEINAMILTGSNYVHALISLNVDKEDARVKNACAFFVYYELNEDSDEINGKNAAFDYLKAEGLIHF